MADHLSKEKRSWNMSRIKSGNTKPEMIVRSLLHSMGYRFRLHGKVSKKIEKYFGQDLHPLKDIKIYRIFQKVKILPV